MWALILADLDKAEEYLQGYQRTDGATPNLSVVYGLKARAYLTMEDWPSAEKYAKLAMEGYNVMARMSTPTPRRVSTRPTVRGCGISPTKLMTKCSPSTTQTPLGDPG